jgi:GNAT superfamily N-acetyltransferase
MSIFCSGAEAGLVPGVWHRSMKEDPLTYVEDLRFRCAGRSDAGAIAALHADSWRRHYRGAYSDSFLDGDVVADRLAVWTDQLREPHPDRYTLLAEDGEGLIAFAHTAFDDDPTWGALLDNLHVAHGQKRRGVGKQILALTAHAVIERGNRLYLWVLEQNVDAQAFYEACGARRVERAPASPPGGVASRLTGSPVKLRFAWADLAVIEDRKKRSRTSSRS